jgi:hypothetical protein
MGETGVALQGSGVFLALGCVLGVGCGGSSSGDSALTLGSSAGSATDTATNSATDPGTSSPTTTTTTGSATDSASASGSSSGGGLKLDVGAGGTTTTGNCTICEGAEFSYIWVANSPDSTVSKINTRTMEEEGRYLTHPLAEGNPSRTSVSVDGKAVTVANRNTGLIKIWSQSQYCDPMANGQAGLQTSSGAGNVLAWGEDDCVAWYAEFANQYNATVQRPVAWTQGTLNRATCEWDDQKVWTVTGTGGATPGQCAGGPLSVHLVNGETGDVEQTTVLSEAVTTCGTLGAYSAAVDLEGDLWFHVHAQSGLVEVELQTMDHAKYGKSQYGLTVDTSGRVWAAGSGVAYRHDPVLNQTDEVWLDTGFSGIAQDLQNRMWIGSSDTSDPRLIGLDLDTMEEVENIDLPDTWYVKGVSVDVDGYIWVVHGNGTRAYRIDPDDFSTVFYEGLNNPYTYSDMTGGQIANVTCNPEG